MLSNGGVIGAATAALQPVRMIESGPAAGALAASLLSKTYGVSDLISFDMGGTTAKACLIQGGEPLITESLKSTGDTGSSRAVACQPLFPP